MNRPSRPVLLSFLAQHPERLSNLIHAWKSFPQALQTKLEYSRALTETCMINNLLHEPHQTLAPSVA